jgi:putative colanic acid biosynthesis acetyltransferase WcaF
MTQPLDAKCSSAVVGKPSFSLSNRLVRTVWNLTWLLLASWTPPPLHPWRRLLLRLFGAKIASTARIYGSARVWYPPHLEMGEYSVMGWQTNCYCQAKVTLEDYANVAQRAFLCAGTHDINDEHFQLITKPIVIKRHAWLAADVFVGPGVTVGEGAVIGARGVAFKDLEPWTVYIGNPLRELKRRRKFA